MSNMQTGPVLPFTYLSYSTYCSANTIDRAQSIPIRGSNLTRMYRAVYDFDKKCNRGVQISVEAPSCKVSDKEYVQ